MARYCPVPDLTTSMGSGGDTVVTRLPVMSRHTIPGRPEEVGGAREFVRAVLGADHPAAETAVLLTSEMVTNSVLHSASAREGGTVTVTVAEVPGHLDGDAAMIRVEVTDDGAPGLPALCPADDTDESGHGLRLVDALAMRWGCHRDGDPRQATTWFDLTS